MNMFSQEYARIYDLVHENKDYLTETSQLIEVMLSKGVTRNSEILDFGCGTGRHLHKLITFGFNSLTGYDINPNMLNVARNSNDKIAYFSEIDALPRRFDFIYSLFDVLSYQISNLDLEIFISQILIKAKPNSYVFIDGWHLPGVQNDPPGDRFKRIVSQEGNFLRNVTVLETDTNYVTNLKIDIIDEGSNQTIFTEIHKMRAFTVDELGAIVKSKGGIDLHFMDGNDYQLPLTANSWRFALIFKKGM